MWGHFRYNTEAINFWLNSCVFPVESRTYPKRMSTSSWHVASSPLHEVVGFSGTNDAHRLLPIEVCQLHLRQHSLHATNGKMLDIILRNPTYHTLITRGGQPLWKAVLDLAMANGIHALVDCGALLAGCSMRYEEGAC